MQVYGKRREGLSGSITQHSTGSTARNDARRPATLPATHAPDTSRMPCGSGSRRSTRSRASTSATSADSPAAASSQLRHEIGGEPDTGTCCSPSASTQVLGSTLHPGWRATGQEMPCTGHRAQGTGPCTGHRAGSGLLTWPGWSPPARLRQCARGRPCRRWPAGSAPGRGAGLAWGTRGCWSDRVGRKHAGARARGCGACTPAAQPCLASSHSAARCALRHRPHAARAGAAAPSPLQGRWVEQLPRLTRVPAATQSGCARGCHTSACTAEGRGQA